MILKIMLESSRVCLGLTRDMPERPWRFLDAVGRFLRFLKILLNHDFLGMLRTPDHDFQLIHVPLEESASHPLSSARGVPQVRKRLRMSLVTPRHALDV